MAFSSNLLDGWEILFNKAEGGLKNCDNIASFFKSISKCEREYSKTILKIVQSQKKDFQKASPFQKEVATSMNCWDNNLKELETIAGIHNSAADQIDEIVKKIMDFIKESQKTRKRLENDGQKLSKEWKNALDNLQKARQKYVQLSKESDVLASINLKSKSDPTLKPNQLSKIDSKAQQAQTKATDADHEYQTILSETNKKQAEYYSEKMPALINEFQQFEEKRIQFMKEMMAKFVSIVRERCPIYISSCDSMEKSIESINIETDIQAFSNENRTGVVVPSDIKYRKYDEEGPPPPKAAKGRAKTNVIPKYKPQKEVDIINTTIWGLTESDQNLTLEEKKTKLINQLNDLNLALTKEIKKKEGVENLVKYYASDQAQQKKAEDEIREMKEKIQKINELKQTLESQLSEIGGNYTPMEQNSNSDYSQASKSLPKKFKALYPYDATCESELSFNEGDVLLIKEQDDNGWWYAELNGNSGYIPNNYVEEI